jgi:hypothetical protein
MVEGAAPEAAAKAAARPSTSAKATSNATIVWAAPKLLIWVAALLPDLLLPVHAESSVPHQCACYDETCIRPLSPELTSARSPR